MCLKGSKESIINIKENINEWMHDFFQNSKTLNVEHFFSNF